MVGSIPPAPVSGIVTVLPMKLCRERKNNMTWKTTEEIVSEISLDDGSVDVIYLIGSNSLVYVVGGPLHGRTIHTSNLSPLKITVVGEMKEQELVPLLFEYFDSNDDEYPDKETIMSWVND